MIPKIFLHIQSKQQTLVILIRKQDTMVCSCTVGRSSSPAEVDGTDGQAAAKHVHHLHGQIQTAGRLVETNAEISRTCVHTCQIKTKNLNVSFTESRIRTESVILQLNLRWFYFALYIIVGHGSCSLLEATVAHYCPSRQHVVLQEKKLRLQLYRSWLSC